MKYLIDKNRKQLVEVIAGEQVTIQIQGRILRGKMENVFSTIRVLDFGGFINCQKLEKGNYVLVKITDNVGVTPDIQ